MNNSIIVASIIAVTLSWGCTKKIDASSETALEKSVKSLTSKISPEKKKIFQESMMYLLLGNADIFSLVNKDADELQRKVQKQVHGKSVDQVIAIAEKIKAENESLREKKEAIQIEKEIEELEATLLKSQEIKKSLSKFEVTKSRFHMRKSRYFGPEPIINLSVKNGTEQAISRAYFRGNLSTPGRSIPWVEEDFNYSIPGGLEPGESASWKLSPNMFSKWGSVKHKSDMVFTVNVKQLDGPKGKVLFEDKWTNESEERLKELKSKRQTH